VNPKVHDGCGNRFLSQKCNSAFLHPLQFLMAVKKKKEKKKKNIVRGHSLLSAL